MELGRTSTEPKMEADALLQEEGYSEMHVWQHLLGTIASHRINTILKRRRNAEQCGGHKT